MKNISRIDQGGTHGWFVRIYGMGKVLCRKFFSDKKHGGREEALAAARRYRDETVKKKPAGRYPAQVRKYRNKVSDIGVSRRGILQRSGNTTYYWTGLYYIDGKVYQKAFSVSQHGEEKARRLAIEFRVSGMGQVLSRKVKIINHLKRSGLA